MRMLVLSLLFDGIGMISYIWPALGEVTDLAWAPIAGMVYFIMYRGVLGVMGGMFTTAEELVPFTDVVPSFTLTWLYMYQLNNEKTFEHFQQRHLRHVPVTPQKNLPLS